jgi:hypothetical protein
MSGFWAIFWLALVMKIPIALLLYLVWWAVKDPPLAEATDDGDGGSRRHGPGPRLPRPQPPRRGPHADPPPRAPARVRATALPARVPDGHLPSDS